MIFSGSAEDWCPAGDRLGGPNEPPGGPPQQPPSRRENGNDDEGEGRPGALTLTRTRTKKPSMYKVLMLNDDSDWLVPVTLLVATVRSLPFGPLIFTVSTDSATLSDTEPEKPRVWPSVACMLLAGLVLSSSALAKVGAVVSTTVKFQANDDTLPEASLAKKVAV